tara:strand:- start:642 stop:899 length:258 start_codon:yes stop_codon:yes gene_type:complete
MNNKKTRSSSEFLRCKKIWFLFLIELNGNPKAVNPLEIVPESFWPLVTDLLINEKYIGQNREYYLLESRKYIEYLSKGGKAFKAI